MNNISNRPGSNYPPMSDSEWKNAPFNEEDYPTKEVNVLCSQILSRDTEVEAQYDKYEDELVDIGQDYYDQHETPLSLIDKFYEILENKEFPKDIDYWKRECKYWCNDETYIEEA
jgi:hypothetical protein